MNKSELKQVSDAELENQINNSDDDLDDLDDSVPFAYNPVQYPTEGDPIEDDSEDDMDYERDSGDENNNDKDEAVDTQNNEVNKKENDNEDDETEQEDSKGNDIADPDMKDFNLDDSDEEAETDEESDEESDDEGAFQKLEQDIQADKLLVYHPELLQNNYKEISAMCKIVRDKNGNIIDPLHRTVPFLTKYEKARVLGTRIKQLNNNADAFIEVSPDIIDARIIAEKELEDKKIPFIIRRPLPNGANEYWRLEDLELIYY
jgi:DNA-directed RNA polymerase I, II, and III subunit RPABC2